MARSKSNKPNCHADGFDIGRLLRPANAFANPMDVVDDRDLTLTEKRAILASWASDACAVETAPALRQSVGSAPGRFDDVMDALKELDRRYGDWRLRPRYRHILDRRMPGVFGRDDDAGPPLN